MVLSCRRAGPCSGLIEFPRVVIVRTDACRAGPNAKTLADCRIMSLQQYFQSLICYNCLDADDLVVRNPVAVVWARFSGRGLSVAYRTILITGRVSFVSPVTLKT